MYQKDYEFRAEDNPGWTDEGNNVISTRFIREYIIRAGRICRSRSGANMDKQ